MKALTSDTWIMEITGDASLVYYKKLSLISVRRNDGMLLYQFTGANDWTIGQLEKFIRQIKEKNFFYRKTKNPLAGSRRLSINN